MPAVKSGKVLVTGANGFVATWVIKNLLEAGYTVRGTVRSASRVPYLKKIFAEYGDKVEFVIVADITKEGAFDAAVEGVDAVAHTASPFHMHADDPKEIIEPAVAGTTSILESTLKHGTGVERVIDMSSMAAIMTLALPTPRVFTEDDWNERAIKEVETKGKDAWPIDKYCASKTLAEKALWAFYERNKGSAKWDVVALNPPYVFGPIIHEVNDVDHLNESMDNWYKNTLKGAADQETLANYGSNWVDVRDVAKATVLALQKDEAGGNRITISAGVWKWQDWVNAARKISPAVPVGNQNYKPENAVHDVVLDATKSVKLLGMTYRSMEETTHDILENFTQKGWWN
ncbi:NAD-P-binding protein [Panus rudis PR-1116 ss-1]|nr:NAD-P-binding protein [Panus rudis PR-1116 ss-1]